MLSTSRARHRSCNICSSLAASSCHNKGAVRRRGSSSCLLVASLARLLNTSVLSFATGTLAASPGTWIVAPRSAPDKPCKISSALALNSSCDAPTDAPNFLHKNKNASNTSSTSPEEATTGKSGLCFNTIRYGSEFFSPLRRTRALRRFPASTPMARWRCSSKIPLFDSSGRSGCSRWSQ